MFEFAISAINDAGNGPYSDPEIGHCGLQHVLVRDLKAAEIGSNWAEIAWNVPLYHGNIIKYDVFYTINGDGERQITVEKDSRHFELDHLVAQATVVFWISWGLSQFYTKFEYNVYVNAPVITILEYSHVTNPPLEALSKHRKRRRVKKLLSPPIQLSANTHGSGSKKRLTTEQQFLYCHLSTNKGTGCSY